jgi:hypothetical protein
MQAAGEPQPPRAALPAGTKVIAALRFLPCPRIVVSPVLGSVFRPSGARYYWAKLQEKRP